jgi:hypothetical protein
MKKSLLLAALLLSSAVQAETWVCTYALKTNIDILNEPIINTFSRNGDGFIYVSGSSGEAVDAEILIENTKELVVQNIEAYSSGWTAVYIHIIDKESKKYITQAVSNTVPLMRIEGSCVKV